MGGSLGHSWRIAGDGNSWQNVLVNLDTNAALHWYARPGAWNDPVRPLSAIAGRFHAFSRALN